MTLTNEKDAVLFQSYPVHIDRRNTVHVPFSSRERDAEMTMRVDRCARGTNRTSSRIRFRDLRLTDASERETVRYAGMLGMEDEEEERVTTWTVPFAYALSWLALIVGPAAAWRWRDVPTVRSTRRTCTTADADDATTVTATSHESASRELAFDAWNVPRDEEEWSAFFTRLYREADETEESTGGASFSS